MIKTSGARRKRNLEKNRDEYKNEEHYTLYSATGKPSSSRQIFISSLHFYNNYKFLWVIFNQVVHPGEYIVKYRDFNIIIIMEIFSYLRHYKKCPQNGPFWPILETLNFLIMSLIGEFVYCWSYKHDILPCMVESNTVPGKTFRFE